MSQQFPNNPNSNAPKPDAEWTIAPPDQAPDDELVFPPLPVEEDVEPIRFEIDPKELEEIASLGQRGDAVLDPLAPPPPPPPPVMQELPPIKPSPAPAPIKRTRGQTNNPSAMKSQEPAAPRPASPSPAASPSPVSRRTRPDVPSPSPVLAPGDSSSTSVYEGFSGSQHSLQDDDLLLIPALTQQQARQAVSNAATHIKLKRAINRRRTMIPVLLTCAVLLGGLAGWWFKSDDDAIVRNSGIWLPVAFIVAGSLMLLLAIINMAQVKHLMRPASVSTQSVSTKPAKPR